MKKQVIVLTDAETAPSAELLDSLGSAGISVLAHDLTETQSLAAAYPEDSHPLAVLYEIPPRATAPELSLVVSRAREFWPGVAIVACCRELSRSGLVRLRLDQQALKRLGFRAIADSPPQLPGLLRQVEDVMGTGDLKLPEGFKPIPDSHAFALPRCRH